MVLISKRLKKRQRRSIAVIVLQIVDDQKECGEVTSNQSPNHKQTIPIVASSFRIDS